MKILKTFEEWEDYCVGYKKAMMMNESSGEGDRNNDARLRSQNGYNEFCEMVKTSFREKISYISESIYMQPVVEQMIIDSEDVDAILKLSVNPSISDEIRVYLGAIMEPKCDCNVHKSFAIKLGQGNDDAVKQEIKKESSEGYLVNSVDKVEGAIVVTLLCEEQVDINER